MASNMGKRESSHILYYDMLNTLFVKEKNGVLTSADKMLRDWKEKITTYHVQSEEDVRIYGAFGMEDFCRDKMTGTFESGSAS